MGGIDLRPLVWLSAIGLLAGIPAIIYVVVKVIVWLWNHVRFV